MLAVERLKQLRKDHKLTQDEIAGKLGIARSTYSGYETGKAEPDNLTLQKIADLFQVSTDYLLGRATNYTSIVDSYKKGEGINEQSASKDYGFAFYGGGRDWTEEEIELAEAAIEAHRAAKKKAEERRNKGK